MRELSGRSVARPLRVGVAGMDNGSDGRPGFALPVGTVTFLLTDIEGSSRAWETAPHAMAKSLTRHHEILDDAIARRGGVRPVEQGEGDSALAAFARASDAAAAAIDAQLALHREPWPEGAELRVRIALHTGEAQLRDEANYFGDPVNRCARIRELAHGGQILVSQSCFDLATDKLPDGAFATDLGSHRLRDLSRPEHIWQLCHPELDREFPALRSLDALPNNLPTQLTTFVGRGPEITEVRALLADARLVTLIGAGGCGKTRLALQVGAELLDGFADGVFWVDLAPLSDPALVPSAVAASVGVRELSHEPLTETLKRHLSSKELLLVLDNCEHVVGACADLVDALLRSCPGVHVLTTSREPVGVEDEVSWRTPSMRLPAERGPVEVEVLSQCEAVRLFIDRARRARPNFKVTNENAPAVAQVCHRLDGIPLAIELAASRTRVLTVEQIAEGLAESFHLLTGGARTALPRQRTLEASVDWSYDMLSGSEPVLFRRLSVFAGSFTLDAAEDVCSDDGIERIQVLDLVAQLADRSLVQVDDEGAEARYRMLETIRFYARQKLNDAKEAAAVRDRHLAYYVALAERAAPELEGPGLFEWSDRLARELDDIRAAIDWSERTDPNAGLLIASAFSDFWSLRGLAREAVARMDTLLALPGADPATRARALVVLSWTLLFGERAEDIARMAELADEALVIARELGDVRTAGRALIAKGWAAGYLEPTTAKPLLEDGIRWAREAQDVYWVASGLNGVSWNELVNGRPDLALNAAEEAAALGEQYALQVPLGRAMLWLSFALYVLGNFEGFESVAKRGLEMQERLHDTSVLLLMLQNYGAYLLTVGRIGDAADLARDLDRRASEAGSFIGTLSARSLDGMVAWARDELDVARDHISEVVVLAEAMGAAYLIAVYQSLLGEVLERQGDLPSAGAARNRALTASSTAGWLARSTALLGCASQARAVGDRPSSRTHLMEALGLTADSGVPLLIAPCLTLFAGLASDEGVWLPAARLAAAARSTLDGIGARNAMFHLGSDRFERDVERIREALGPQFDEAWAEGAAMSMDEAVAYAMKGHGERQRPSAGWESLTPAETNVVKLVAEGLTNKQVAEKLFISSRTVQSHLRSVFAKVGVSTRAELASEATRRRL